MEKITKSNQFHADHPKQFVFPFVIVDQEIYLDLDYISYQQFLYRFAYLKLFFTQMISYYTINSFSLMIFFTYLYYKF